MKKQTTKQSNKAVPLEDLSAAEDRLGKKIYIVGRELKRTEKVLRSEILRVEERVENVEDGMKRLERKLTDKIDGIEVKIDRIATQLDGFVGRVDNLDADNEVGAHQIRELRVRVDGHEKRISVLESKN